MQPAVHSAVRQLLRAAIVLGAACSLCGSRESLAQDRSPPGNYESSLRQYDQWAEQLTWSREERSPQKWLEALEQLLDARDKVDTQLEKLFGQCSEFSQLEPGDARRQKVSQHLARTAYYINLSGRLRYFQRDALDNATFALTESPTHLDRLIDQLVERKSQIGAIVLSFVLFDPAPEENLEPFPIATKRKVLDLIAATRPLELLEDLVELVKDERTSPELVVASAEAIRAIGVPQDARPGQDPELPKPAITARELLEVLRRVDAEKLPEGMRSKLPELKKWLEQRAEKGVVEDEYRVGTAVVRPGDWLLMRNPSPYNLFTDHSPGLFTHVGVVAVENDADGRRRFVIVDLPERGDRIPATNVETFLQRTLHYVLLRHRDPAIASQLGTAAAKLIDRPSQFDLQFRTDRVLALKGQSIADRPVHTYCAGFLLLCALQTEAPWNEFFPIVEQPAGNRCAENLAKLGLSIGKDFLSPTGALFSPKLEIIGRCEPMYEPTREIQEAVYDHFARSMIDKRLTPSPDTFQALRERLGAVSKRNRTVARALARANNVSADLDLESAAKAAAVVETLDQIAQRASDDFLAARDAITVTDEQLREEKPSREELNTLRQMRTRHADLHRAWVAERLSPSQLRDALVTYYRQQGQRQLDERFFR